jgi:hypothetical protein
MKAIIRRRLAALLSLVGLAGSASATQVIKGSDEGTKIKTETTVKGGKNAKESRATAAYAAKKHRKNSSAQYPIEHGKEASLTTNKTDGSRKQLKNSSEINAAKTTGKSKTTTNVKTTDQQ